MRRDAQRKRRQAVTQLEPLRHILWPAWYKSSMCRTWIVLAVAVAIPTGCGGNSTSRESADASTDGPSDAPLGSSGDASTRDSSSPRCTTGLSATGTASVVCGGDACGNGEPCCIGAKPHCQASCPNLELAWACDRSTHCGPASTCCWPSLFLDLMQCPGTDVPTGPVCQVASRTCAEVVCQTDADCPGQTCYAVLIKVGSGRTVGLCR